MKRVSYRITVILLSVIFNISSMADAQDFEKTAGMVSRKMKGWNNPLTEWKHIGRVRFDSVKQGESDRSLSFYFSQPLSYYPLREDNIAVFRKSLHESLGRRFRKYDIRVVTNGFELEQLVPNIFRKEIPADNSRKPPAAGKKIIPVKNLSAVTPDMGLSGKSIALWHSHGYYYEMNLDRWEWQRARLFGVVEDISVMGYVLPYLAPMLENAGAGVFLPRERDTQLNEVIVDNNRSTGISEVVIHPSAKVLPAGEGFIPADTLFSGENPFRMGTAIWLENDSALFIPEIPEDGYYWLSVSYPVSASASPDVLYCVNHTGGMTVFSVDQRAGGGTWIYLGRFHFRKGKDAQSGSVMIKPGPGNTGKTGIDAVRFGGGMGNVARRPSREIIANQRSVSGNEPSAVVVDDKSLSQVSWKTSGKPRFLEGSRYWLQYAGMPDTLVYSPNNYKNDYNDDYQSRGAWVNYLMASPDSTPGGLGIPVDLALAFHTDAGITPGDSVIGTLAIYSTASGNGRFPDGSSRMASRDLSDIIQTQIVNDIRLQYDTDWTRRGLWDRPYSEARRPDVPSMLLELLSHQNLADQKFGLDPRFRYSVSRSVYKGILKYFAYIENRDYMVQPEPVTDLAVTFTGERKVLISWKPGAVDTEPGSEPDRYRISLRKGDGGFDNGRIVKDTKAEFDLDSTGVVYSFRVTAINRGGESFPSEVLSAGISEKSPATILVVNGFDRISGPELFDDGKMAGLAWWKDRGVADHYDISYVGDQYDFDRKSPWLDDDAPGWGASYADMEGRVIPGNTFDFVSVHGRAILAAGYSFCSVSDEYFCSDRFSPEGYSTADILFGEEKSISSFRDPSLKDFSIYTGEFMDKIRSISKKGINIIISGSYIGSELQQAGDSAAIKFASEYLHFKHRTGHAVNSGDVYSTDYARPSFSVKLSFNTRYNPGLYSAESPDAIEPAGKGSFCVLRYSQNNTSAGVAYKGSGPGTVAIGFPIETVTSEMERNNLMKQILRFLHE